MVKFGVIKVAKFHHFYCTYPLTALYPVADLTEQFGGLNKLHKDNKHPGLYRHVEPCKAPVVQGQDP